LKCTPETGFVQLLRESENHLTLARNNPMDNFRIQHLIRSVDALLSAIFVADDRPRGGTTLIEEFDVAFWDLTHDYGIEDA
jgi:hypothetical protein